MSLIYDDAEKLIDGRETFFSLEYKGAEETQEDKECPLEVREDNCLTRTLQQLRGEDRYNIGEAWYAKNHGVYHYIVIVLFADHSARYEGVKLRLENSFIKEFNLGYLFEVVSQERFDAKYKGSTDDPIPVTLCIATDEMEGQNQFNGSKPT